MVRRQQPGNILGDAARPARPGPATPCCRFWGRRVSTGLAAQGLRPVPMASCLVPPDDATRRPAGGQSARRLARFPLSVGAVGDTWSHGGRLRFALRVKPGAASAARLVAFGMLLAGLPVACLACGRCLVFEQRGQSHVLLGGWVHHAGSPASGAGHQYLPRRPRLGLPAARTVTPRCPGISAPPGPPLKLKPPLPSSICAEARAVDSAANFAASDGGVGGLKSKISRPCGPLDSVAGIQVNRRKASQSWRRPRP